MIPIPVLLFESMPVWTLLALLAFAFAVGVIVVML